MRKELVTRILFSDFDGQNYNETVKKFRKDIRDEFEELFDLNYPETLDFAHSILDKGMCFRFFLKENPQYDQTLNPTYIRDLPEDMQRDYRTYLKSILIDGGYQDSAEDFEDNGTGISNYKLSCIEELQEELDYLPESALVQQQRIIVNRRNMVESLKELRTAMYDVSEAWFHYDIDELLITGEDVEYPFKGSFDEVASVTVEWVEYVLNKIKEETENAK